MPRIARVPQLNGTNPWSPNSQPYKALVFGPSAASAVSTVYPSANLAILIPFYYQFAWTIANCFWYNGATLGGNIDVGVYTPDGRRLVSLGTTAQVGASTLQTAALALSLTAPGQYLLALACDSATATLFAGALGGLEFQKMIGAYQVATSFPLPATITLAAPSFDYVPFFGITPRSFV